MKNLGCTIAVAGFIIIVGTAGNADFYEECRRAADCVAGEPMSTLQMTLQSLAGLVMMAIGVKMITSK